MISLNLNTNKDKTIVLIRIILILLGIGLVILLNRVSLKNTKPACDKCNVILVSLDTLGSNHLPCYGYTRDTATNLCNFANENVLFTNSFSNAGWTIPSHYSIFTSLYPNHHGVIDYDSINPESNNNLDPKVFTMAEFFKGADYETIYVGPLEDSSLPLNRGFGRGFDTLINMKSWWILDGWQQAISQLKNNNKNKESTFVFLHTYMVHDPYFVDLVSEGTKKRMFTDDYYGDIPLNIEEWNFLFHSHIQKIIKLYENELKSENVVYSKTGKTIVESLKSAKNDNEAGQILINLFGESIIKNEDYLFFYDRLATTKGKVMYVEALYDEMIYYLDKRLSIIFDLVVDTELVNNTIIVFTSDHGEAFMEHGAMVHPGDHLYNTTTSVPLIMYIPGVRNKKIDNMVQSIDILPTLLKLTGVNKRKHSFDGIDLTDLILDKSDAKINDFLISEGVGIDTIRDSRWKLYIKGSASSGNLTYELYDLFNDPLEQSNEFLLEPQIVKNLEENLNRIIYKK